VTDVGRVTGLRAAARVSEPAAPVGWPAWRLRNAMAAGELQIVDVVAAHLDRLAEVEPVLNAAVAVRHDAALREAAQAQARLDAGAPAGPLLGVPFTVKDVLATADLPTRCGSAAFAMNQPEVDAVAVRRFRDAGAILIAKTNCPEFAFGVTTDNDTHGRTGNPWGMHSPGGSSGGEAALIAAGAAALGLGTDYGGSLRWPAQCCGILALRPGLGCVDGTGQLPGPGGRMDGHSGALRESVQRHFQVVGPLARTARDLALALAVISTGPGAVVAVAQAARGIDDQIAALRGVPVGWLVDEASQAVDAQVRGVVSDAVAALRRAGLTTLPTVGLLDGLHSAFNELRATDGLDDLRTAIGGRRDLVGRDARAQLDSAPLSLADPAPLWAEIRRLRAGVLAALARTPVVLAPVAPASACRPDGSTEIDGVPVSGFALMSLCRAVSALGLPALSVPVGLDPAGLPVSVQVIAAPGGEDLVLRMAVLLETVLGGAPTPPWLSTSH
jgi:amidase